MEDKYTPALLSTKGKAVVLIASAALLSAGVYGVTRATQGFEVLDLAPDGHHAQECEYLCYFPIEYIHCSRPQLQGG